MSDYKGGGKKVSSFDIMEDLSLFGGDLFSSHVLGVTFTSYLIDFNEMIILTG